MRVPTQEFESWIGRTIGGRYRLLRLIGRGGMGGVFVAIQENLQRQVAIKVIEPYLRHDEATVERFRQEARLVARLNHPNIVTVHDFGEIEDGGFYIAMELLGGESLYNRLEAGRKIPWPETLGIMRDILSALVAAHGSGIIHRDLKPDNIMLVREPTGLELAKVLDFGVAKLNTRDLAPADRPRPLTESGVIVGTPAYMAPETLIGGQTSDPRSDLYAVGLIWLEMLLGRRVFDAETPGGLAIQQVSQRPPSPKAELGDGTFPDALDELIGSLVEKDVEARCQSALLAVRALDALMTASSSGRPISGLHRGIVEERPPTDPVLALPEVLQTESSMAVIDEQTVRLPPEALFSTTASESEPLLDSGEVTPFRTPVPPPRRPAPVPFRPPAYDGAPPRVVTANHDLSRVDRRRSTTFIGAAIALGVVAMVGVAFAFSPRDDVKGAREAPEVAVPIAPVAVSTSTPPAAEPASERGAEAPSAPAPEGEALAALPTPEEPSDDGAATPPPAVEEPVGERPSPASTPVAVVDEAPAPTEASSSARRTSAKSEKPRPKRPSPKARTTKVAAKPAPATPPSTPEPPATAEPAAPVDEPPRLTSALLKRSIAAMLGQAKHCTNTNIKFPEQGPGLLIDHCPSYKTIATPQKLELRIAPDGTLLEVRFTNPEAADSKIGRCIVQSIGAWKFPAFKSDEPVTVSQRVVFEPCVPINGKCVF